MEVSKSVIFVNFLISNLVINRIVSRILESKVKKLLRSAL